MEFRTRLHHLELTLGHSPLSAPQGRQRSLPQDTTTEPHLTPPGAATMQNSTRIPSHREAHPAPLLLLSGHRKTRDAVFLAEAKYPNKCSQRSAVHQARDVERFSSASTVWKPPGERLAKESPGPVRLNGARRYSPHPVAFPMSWVMAHIRSIRGPPF